MAQGGGTKTAEEDDTEKDETQVIPASGVLTGGGVTVGEEKQLGRVWPSTRSNNVGKQGRRQKAEADSYWFWWRGTNGSDG